MKAQIISFRCILKDPLGRIISSSFNHDVLTEKTAPRTEYHDHLRGLNAGLQDLKKGEKRQIFLSAEDAYGLYDPELLIQLPRKKLPRGECLKVGYQVVTQSQEGEWRMFRVTAADSITVTLDGNHPLAGQDLLFDIEATSAREATAEELEQAKRPACSQMLH